MILKQKRIFNWISLFLTSASLTGSLFAVDRENSPEEEYAHATYLQYLAEEDSQENMPKILESLTQDIKDADYHYTQARMYEEGTDVKKDRFKAMEHYKKAGQKGHPTAAADFVTALFKED